VDRNGENVSRTCGVGLGPRCIKESPRDTVGVAGKNEKFLLNVLAAVIPDRGRKCDVLLLRVRPDVTLSPGGVLCGGKFLLGVSTFDPNFGRLRSLEISSSERGIILDDMSREEFPRLRSVESVSLCAISELIEADFVISCRI